MQLELRIHGVSGTPAADLVGGPTRPDPRFGGDPPTVLAPAGGPEGLLAYRWDSQTSGTAASAMWLLLVPYMLLNLAGWALPPAEPTRHRAGVAAVRVAGLALTLVFALVTANGVIGIGAYEVVRPATSWTTALLAGVTVSSLVMGLLWFAGSRADPGRNDRPYLRAPHMAVALWGVWAAAATAVAETTGAANPIGTMWLLPTALMVLAAAASVWHGLEDLTRLLGRIAVGAVLILQVAVVLRPLDVGASALPEALGSLGGPLRGAVLVYMGAAAVGVGLAWSTTHRDAGPAVATLLSLAGATGASVGAGAVVLTGAVFGVRPSASTGALAESFLVGTLAVGVMAAIHVWSHVEPAARPLERAFLTLVSVRDDIRPLLLAVPAVAVAVAAVALGGAGALLPWMALAAGVGCVGGTAAVAWRLGSRPAAAVAVGVGVVVIAAVGLGWLSFRQVAVAFALVLPAAAVVTRVVGAVRDPERRRMLAIPWDVGSFFSRRFHPFAPPTYRDVVERDLRMVLSRLRATGDTVVVSAHSQGSVVAAAALDGMPGPGLGLVTHGSPIGPLLMRFFPISFPAHLPEQLGPRPWINLWRPTDPVGGRIPGPIDDRRIADTHLRIHGGYWLTDEPRYREAVEHVARES